MHIRKATFDDVRRISYLISRNTEKVFENNYSNEQKMAWKKANTPKSIKDSLNKRLIFCAFEQQQLVGTIGLQENEVVGLYVSFSKRGLGIGKALLSFLEAYAFDHKITKLSLTATPSGFPFYLKNGYISDESVIIKINGIDFKEMRMTKKLG